MQRQRERERERERDCEEFCFPLALFFATISPDSRFRESLRFRGQKESRGEETSVRVSVCGLFRKNWRVGGFFSRDERSRGEFKVKQVFRLRVFNGDFEV